MPTMFSRCARRTAAAVAGQRNYAQARKIELPPCDFHPEPYKGPPLEQIEALRKAHVHPNVLAFSFYPRALGAHQGHMQYLFDHEGNRYLDLIGGICTISVGHAHPKIAQRVAEQAKRLVHITNIYHHPQIATYAKKLADKFPGDLKVVYFLNSGSEANDLAIQMARAYTRKFEILAIRNAYHGVTAGALGLTDDAAFNQPTPGGFGISHVMLPDPYRGVWGGARCRDSPVQVAGRKCACRNDDCHAADRYVEQFDEHFAFGSTRKNLAAFFAESIQGIGGTVQYPRTFLRRAVERVKENGGLYIADEVQTGFGRTGDTFWGFESHGVRPDIVTLAKGMGNGFPMAAVVTTAEIAGAFAKGAAHFNTYGGNPLGCTVGETVLDIIEEEGLQRNSLEVGTYFLGELAKLRDTVPCVGDVRGKGLMIGVELVADRESRKPLEAERFGRFWNATRDMGLLLGKGGPYRNVLRIKPPMCMTHADADFAVAVMREAFSKM